MSFTTKTAEISRTPTELAVITAGYCGNDYSVWPCTAGTVVGTQGSEHGVFSNDAGGHVESTGILTITHSGSQKFVQCEIYDNNKTPVIPDSVTMTSTSSVVVDLTSFGSLSGFWDYVITYDTSETGSFTDNTGGHSSATKLLTITHALGSQYVQCKIFDNADQEIIPDNVTMTDGTTVTIDLTTFGTLTGTWNYLVTYDDSETGAFTDTTGGHDGTSDQLAITHSLRSTFVQCAIFNNSDEQVIVDSALMASYTSVDVDMRSFSTLTGTWNYLVTYSAATVDPAEECYRTFYTCQDQANFSKITKDYKFVSFNTPISFPGPRPYIQSISSLPTMLDNNTTVKGRRKISMVDEFSDDINVDPYLSERSSVQGTFWKKFIARNPNYAGSTVKIYDGYLGLLESEFVERWTGIIDNITAGNGAVSVSCVDNLAELSKVTVPDSIKSKIPSAITDSDSSIILDNILLANGEDDMDSAGYILIDDEIIQYTGLTTAYRTLTGCTRGKLGTTAAAHDADAKVTIVKYYDDVNPFDLLQTMLTGSGVALTDIDTATWSYWRDWPATDLNFSAVITERDRATVHDLFWEIVNILGLYVWQDENQLITIKRSIANEPNRTYTDLNDTANIIYRSGNTDYNEQSRRTRFILHWTKSTLGELNKLDSYSEVDIAVDADAEGESGYGDIKDETILCRWISKSYLQEEAAELYASGIVGRRLIAQTRANPIISVSVELKDEAIKTGDNVTLSTDEVLQVDGSSISESFLVISREKSVGRVNLKLRRMPVKRICFIAPNTHPIYASATAAQREYGFISNAQGEMPNGDGPYLIW